MTHKGKGGKKWGGAEAGAIGALFMELKGKGLSRHARAGMGAPPPNIILGSKCTGNPLGLPQLLQCPQCWGR